MKMRNNDGKRQTAVNTRKALVELGAMSAIRKEATAAAKHLSTIATAASGIAESVKALQFVTDGAQAKSAILGLDVLMSAVQKRVGELGVNLRDMTEAAELCEKRLRVIRGYEIAPLAVALNVKVDAHDSDERFLELLDEAQSGAPEAAMGKLILLKAKLREAKNRWTAKATKLRERCGGAGSTLPELKTAADKLVAIDWAVEQLDRREATVDEVFLGAHAAAKARLDRLTAKFKEAGRL